MKHKNKVVRLFALSTCPACKKTRALLKQMRVQCEVINVDLLEGGEQWATTKELKRYNPRATFPTMVVENVVCGFDEDAITEALKP